MMTPIELQNKTFKSGGLGYDKKDVEAFFREVSSSYESLYKKNVELSDKINVLNEGLQYYKTIETTIQKALVLAENTAEETKEAARQNAKAIEAEAKVKAKMILEDANKELNMIHQKTIQLIEQYELYKTQFKNLANAQTELLASDAFQIHVANLSALIPEEKETTELEKVESEIQSETESSNKDSLQDIVIENL